jgi:putative membrane protein
MEMVTNATPVLSAIIFTFLGLGLFAVGFWAVDRFTPYHLWKEVVQEKNIALAIVVGAISIGICNIIAAAIHG